MKVAIWLSDDMIPTKGGGASYYKTLIQGIDSYHFDESIEIVYVTYRLNNSYSTLRKKVVELYPNNLMMAFFEVPRRFFDLLESFAWKDKIEYWRNKYYINKKLQKEKIDVIYYIQPTCKIQDFPFIVQNWDLGFLSMYSFPEVSRAFSFKVWNRFYSHYLKKAFFIFSESEAGKEELINYLRINPKKIEVVPLFPNQSLLECKEDNSIITIHELVKNQYFFYPAQFWAHKNHYNLLRAFSIFLVKNPHYKLVLTGSDKGNLAYIKKCIVELKLSNNVILTGFISENRLKSLYKNATALVMPTFLGPTNMPLLEATSLGCKVICSDLKGHKEQLGEKALYFHPQDYNDILEKMYSIIHDKNIHSKTLQKQNIFTLENALLKIERNLIKIADIRKCWK